MTRSILTLCLALVMGNGLFAQNAEMIAYVPATPPDRTADDTRITFTDPVVPGVLDVTLPEGTHRIDLLNARGKVKRTHEVDQFSSIDLGQLRRGTWTIRAHTPTGMVVRRFFVMGHGKVLWELPMARRRR